MSAPRYDVCIVGGGLIGLALGRELMRRRPGRALLLLEKEARVGVHQSGHNSGVIHSGLYYRPGSLKAKLAVAGARSMYELCESAGIGYRRSGKLVIATDRREVPALEELERRGRANGLEGLERIGPRQISEIEPEAVGVMALHVPSAGVVDFSAVADYLAAELQKAGAELRLNHTVSRITPGSDRLEIVAGGEVYRSRILVNCAGLHSDRVARLAGIAPSVGIVPFRGEYYTLSPAHLVKGLIYPVPDPRYPFLGVHFTRRIDGSVEVGPNALLALGREHYRGAKPDWVEVRNLLFDPGFRRLAASNLLAGARELINSRFRRLYARLARRLVPAVRAQDLITGGAGVRAQAVDRNGRLVDDFVIESTERSVHVLNAPSPGATASLAIGGYIADLVDR